MTAINALPQQLTTSSGRGYAAKLALAFAAIYLLWGSTYLAIRYSVETIPPLLTAGIRFSIAGSILFAWAWTRGFRPKREHWMAGAIVGALLFLGSHGMLYWAEQTVASGQAALLIATEPMFILIFGWMAGQQKISRLSALGLGFGLVGVGLITGVEYATSLSLLGLAAVLLASASWAAGVVISPRVRLPANGHCVENYRECLLCADFPSVTAIRQLKRKATPSFSTLRPPPGGRRLAAARTGVSDCAGFAPN